VTHATSDFASDPREPWDSPRLIQQVLDTAGEGVVVYDRELRHRLWNRFMEQRTGLSAEDAHGQVCHEQFPHLASAGIVACIRRALAGEMVQTPDYQYQSPYNGRAGWSSARLTPLRDADGTVVGVIGHFRDITERKAAEAALRESEALYRTIIESATDIVTILDRQGIARYISPASLPVLGLRPDEMVGRNPIDWIHPDDRQVVLDVFRAILDPSSPPPPVQYRSRHADGSWRRLMSSARNLLDDPVVRGIVISSRDVTAWEELQARLHQSQRIEAVGRLAGGVAHDFNNLLTVVRGNAQLLLASSTFTGEQLVELEEISQAADRAAALTRQLLAFSRQQVLQPRVLDLNEVVRSMSSLLERLVGEAVALELRPADALWAVTADPVQVEQVLLNLVVNARDAMPSGGTLVVTTRNVVADEEFARAHAPMPPGEYVALALRDSGVGMDPTTLARVFEPFFTTKELGQGTGMGLSTVYGVVKQSGGYIWVESAVGEGTSFSIYLPRSVADARPVTPRAPVEEVRRGTETILVVEDEQLVRALTRRTLERTGYRVYEAGNGAEALNVARELGDRLQLVITDIVMPVMGGRELAATLRRERPSLTILFMSGYTHEREAHLSAGGGMSHFLHKPFTLDELRSRVRLLLDLTPSAA